MTISREYLGPWALKSNVFGNPVRAVIHMLCYIACREHVQVKNPYLDTMEEDILYHFSLGTKTHNLPEMFGDIKVCEMHII